MSSSPATRVARSAMASRSNGWPRYWPPYWRSPSSGVSARAGAIPERFVVARKTPARGSYVGVETMKPELVFPLLVRGNPAVARTGRRSAWPACRVLRPTRTPFYLETDR
ncbi:protein of unknown function [Pararobbsia alpina]